MFEKNSQIVISHLIQQSLFEFVRYLTVNMSSALYTTIITTLEDCDNPHTGIQGSVLNLWY